MVPALCLFTLLTSTSAFEFRFDLRIGSRSSALAVAQAELMAAQVFLTAPGTMTTLVPIDADADWKLGEKLTGVDFTSELDEAVLDRALDLAVHSLKDVPPTHRWRRGLTIACHLPRASPLDVIVGAPSLDALPTGARVGTASVRRRAQLLAARPDLTVMDVRGTVGKRVAQLDEGHLDALVLAKAGIERLGGLEGRLVAELSPSVMLPGAGQGIVCAVCREDAIPQHDALISRR